MMLGYTVAGAEVRNDRVQLSLQPKKECPVTIETDHVIVATGYRADIDQLHFIDETLRSRIQTIERMPELSANFKSSVPGLYFVGIAASGSFGPLMRFVFGCDFAARRISGHVVRQ